MIHKLVFTIGCFPNIKHVELALKSNAIPNLGFFMTIRCTKHHKLYTKIHSMLPYIHNNYKQHFVIIVLISTKFAVILSST